MLDLGTCCGWGGFPWEAVREARDPVLWRGPQHRAASTLLSGRTVAAHGASSKHSRQARKPAAAAAAASKQQKRRGKQAAAAAAASKQQCSLYSLFLFLSGTPVLETSTRET